MGTFKKTAITSAVLIMLGHGGLAFAQSNALPGVEVSGNSILPSNIENLPGSSNVLTREDLDKREPFSILELVRDLTTECWQSTTSPLPIPESEVSRSTVCRI